MTLYIVPLFLTALLAAFPHGETEAWPRTTYAAPEKVGHVRSQMQQLPLAKATSTKPVTKRIVANGTSRPASQRVAQVATSAPSAKAPLDTAPTPTAPSAPSMTSLEALVVAEINAARAKSGLKALTSDSRLASIARAHSADMLAQNYFSHTSPSGCDAVCRYQNAGYVYWSMAENIYWMWGFSLSPEATAQKVVDGWQNSPGHRANDLGDFTHIGVGIAASGSRVHVTANFSTPR